MNAFNFDAFQTFSKSQAEAAAAFVTSVSRGWQEMASEAADYSKQAWSSSAETFEKLASAKSVASALEIQSDFAKSAYEGLVARTTKINEIVARTAGDAMKPAQSLMANAATA